ncbi:MAG: hypothetical protein AAGD22_17280 [Verrucomicrobiota bacterium]
MKIKIITILAMSFAGAWTLSSALANHHKEGEKKDDTELAQSSQSSDNAPTPEQRERGQRPGGQRGDRPGGGGPAGPQSGGGFAVLDTDGDGAVSNAEFLAAQITRANETFERLDADGDGSISESESASAQRGGQGGQGGQQRGPGGGRLGGGFGGGFATLDENNDGIVTEAEFVAANANRQKEIFAQIDTDGSGEITEEDMQAFFQRMRERFSGGRGGPGGPRGGGPSGGGAPDGGNPRPPRPE